MFHLSVHIRAFLNLIQCKVGLLLINMRHVLLEAYLEIGLHSKLQLALIFDILPNVLQQRKMLKSLQDTGFLLLFVNIRKVSILVICLLLFNFFL